MLNGTKAKLAAAGAAIMATVLPAAHAGIGADIVTEVKAATTEANLVYVAVIGAFAAFFVVKLIRKAL